MPDREMKFGESAGRDIIRTVQEHARRMINATGPRGRWFGRQGTKPTANEDLCCCPKCTSKTGVEACCPCLPRQICVEIVQNDIIIGRTILDWLDGDVAKPFDIGVETNLGTCTLQFVLTNGYDPRKNYNTGACGMILLPMSECLSNRDCALFVPVDCEQWRIGQDPLAMAIEFPAINANCDMCLNGEIIVRLKPIIVHRPKCKGCTCAPNLLCARVISDVYRIPADLMLREVDQWNGSMQVGCDTYPISFRIRPDCRGNCVMQFEGFDIKFADEQHWKLLDQCPAIDYTWPIHLNESQYNSPHTITLQSAGCQDCDGCCLPNGLGAITIEFFGTGTGWGTVPGSDPPVSDDGQRVLFDTITVPWRCPYDAQFNTDHKGPDINNPNPHPVVIDCINSGGRFGVTFSIVTWWGGIYNGIMWNDDPTYGWNCESSTGHYKVTEVNMGGYFTDVDAYFSP